MLPCNTTGHNNKSNVLNIEKKSIKKITTIQKNLAYNYIKCFALHNYRVISNNKSHIQFNLWGQKQTTNIFFSIHIISLSVCSIYQIILLPLFFTSNEHNTNEFSSDFWQTYACEKVLHIPWLILLMRVCHNKEISMHRKIVNLTLSIVRLCSTVKFGPNFWPTYPEFELRTEGIFLNNFNVQLWSFTKVTRLSLFAEHL